MSKAKAYKKMLMNLKSQATETLKKESKIRKWHDPNIDRAQYLLMEFYGDAIG